MGQPRDTQGTSSRNHATPGIDSGLLLRAAELGTGEVPAANALPGGFCGDDPGDVARALASTTGWLAHTATMSADALLQSARGGAAVFAPTENGWLVASRRRATLLTATGEHHHRLSDRTLRRLLGSGAAAAIVLEPRFALEPLASDDSEPRSPWSRLRALLRIEANQAWPFVLYAVVLGATSLAVPIAAQVLVNTIAFGSLLQPLVVLAVILCGVLTLGGAIQVLEWYAVEVLQRRLFVRVTEDFARRLPTLSYELQSRLSTRELVNRFFDVVSLQKSAGRLLVDGLGLALQTVVGLTLLALYHPLLLGFAAALVLGLGLVVLLGRGAVGTAVAESKAKFAVAAWLEEIAGRPTVFKRPPAALFAARQADLLTRRFLSARSEHYRRVLRQLWGGVGVQIVAMTTLLGLGGWLVMQQELTLGQLVAAEIVVGVIGTGFMKAGKLFETSYDLLASVDKIGAVIDATRDNDVRQTAAVGPLGLAISELEAPTSPTTSVTLSSTRVETGSRLLLAGGESSDRSTLLEILAGLRPTGGGQLRVAEFTGPAAAHTERLRQHAYLLRPDDVIDGSVLDNLRLGAPELTPEQAWDVLERVRLRDAVAALPEGLSSRVLANGAPLSASEASRLCVARALVARPGLLLADEALDNLGLDSASEADVIDAVLGPDAGWTALVSSRHRPVWNACGGVIRLKNHSNEELRDAV